MSLHINNRLQKLSDFLYRDDCVIDIGCDHGLLGIYLVLNKKIEYVISSDINEKPLNKAKENIKRYHLENKIETRLGNGLSCIDDNINTIVISGMGGETINSILTNIKKCPNVRKIVVSPNSDFAKTRKFITKLGFFLEKETMVLENGKYYLISCYQKGNRRHINYYFGKLLVNDITVYNYYQEIYQKNKKIILNLQNKHLRKKWSLMLENFFIKNYIFKSKKKKIFR